MTYKNENLKSQDTNPDNGPGFVKVQPVTEPNFFTSLLQKERIGYLVGILVILVAAAGVWYWQDQRVKNVMQEEQVQTPEELLKDPNESIVLTDGSYFVPPDKEIIDYTKFPNANTSVQWINPAKLSDLKLVLASNGETAYSADFEVLYYHLGNRGNNKVILAQAPAIDPSGPVVYMFEETAQGYVFMSLMSSQELYRSKDSPGYYVLTTEVVSSDTKSYYHGIIGPEKITFSGFNLTSPGGFVTNLFSLYLAEKQTIDNFTSKQIGTLPEGELYLFQQQSSAIQDKPSPEKFFIRRFVLKLPSGLYTNYNIAYDFFTDEQIPNITWTDYSKNKDIYRKDATLGGCGNIGAYVVAERDITSSLKLAGMTSSNINVYDFIDVNHPTLDYFYQLQGGKIYNLEKSEMEPISKEEWFKHHPVIALENGFGEYTLMTNSTYGIMAECGKPVVYLYPEKTTVVTVQVGADVTVSEPEYKNGWKVLAQPNGQLKTADGGIYGSLFWEGLGHGEYPQITKGTVVARDQVEETITEQLKQQGLNEQESKDFKDFWLGKMPDSPYVRLTWFTTSQMDELAPLVVLPRPDTVIRVFLDYQGLDKPVNLPAQHLTSLQRKGFTVVEWGGLLRK